MTDEPRIDVYLDTSAIKFAVARRTVYQPRPQTVTWGDITTTVDVYDRVELDVIGSLENPELRREARLLRLIADGERAGTIRLFMNSETELESWGLPKLDSMDGRFFGAEIGFAPAPVRYGRVIMGAGMKSAKELQYEFLQTLRDKRFLELQKITGAYQGKHPPNRNQLLDAFHVWCAEYNGCRYFLTLDFKLVGLVERHRDRLAPRVVRPSTLVEELGLDHPDFPHPNSSDQP